MRGSTNIFFLPGHSTCVSPSILPIFARVATYLNNIIAVDTFLGDSSSWPLLRL